MKLDRWDRILLWIIGLTAAALIALFVLYSEVRNSQHVHKLQIIRLLSDPKAERSADAGSRIASVKLSNGVKLIPDREQTVEGYTLQLHLVAPEAYTISARPESPSERPMVSFFLDEKHVLRFESGPGRIADASSRPLR